MPALPHTLGLPIWKQFYALLPERDVDHSLDCHRPHICNRVIFEKLVQILVFGCAYWRIADKGCSTTTLGRRRDEWIDAGVMVVGSRGQGGLSKALLGSVSESVVRHAHCPVFVGRKEERKEAGLVEEGFV